MMRGLLIAIASLAASPVFATETTEVVVTFLKEACVRPESPGAKLAAAEQFAASRAWKLDEAKSGRRPFEFMGSVDPSGAPFSIQRVWKTAPDSKGAQMALSIVGPENPDITMNVCIAMIPGPNFVDDELSDEVERQLSADLFEARPRSKAYVAREWFFLEDWKRPANCSKRLMINRNIPPPGNSTTISFIELSAARGSKWAALANVGDCSKL